jgi:hypothetical protein
VLSLQLLSLPRRPLRLKYRNHDGLWGSRWQLLLELDISVVIGKHENTWVKNVFFYSRSSYSIETGIFGGNLLAHILIKSKYVLSIWSKDNNWNSFNCLLLQKIIKYVWLLEPMNLMRDHAWTFHKCSFCFEHYVWICFLQVHFELIEVPVGSKCTLCKEKIVDLANIQETSSFRLRRLQRIIQRIRRNSNSKYVARHAFSS